ncbi:MAG: hypothetical protein NZ521_04360 [Flammeovirgaceae bacterium]|nr:hypothetical protein [Flammeovirgaceae bacterium]MDW8287399.1 hypothetical protein [Flammeovirgaceae bacterium]
MKTLTRYSAVLISSLVALILLTTAVYCAYQPTASAKLQKENLYYSIKKSV